MDLLTTTLAEAAEAIKSRKLSPVELAQYTLDRIDLLEPRLNAFITLCGDRAMEAARVAEQEIIRGRYRGPMHGIPYGVKDIFATAGLRTTNGSKVFQDHVPDVDSTAVRNLDAAGGVLVGKNNCAEFASGGDHSSFHGAVHNPWGLEYSPGGSSSGSGAAVAAGMLFGSMGTCTGGSIRGPASYCSVVGLKPSYGLVSRHGVFPLSWSIDHAGPMTRTVEDCALMLEAVAGYDPLDPSSANVRVPHYAGALDGNIRGMRIGITRELNEGAGAETGELVQRAFEVLRELGAEVEEVPVPITGDYATVAGNVITWAECAQIHAPWRDRLSDYSVGVREKVLVGSVLPSAFYHKAQEMRRAVQAELTEVLQRYDVLVGYTTNNPAGLLEAGTTGGTAMGMATARSSTRPYNLTGMPAVSVPCGFVASNGLPVGLHISGRLFDDATVLKVAHAYEQAAGWYTRHPDL